MRLVSCIEAEKKISKLFSYVSLKGERLRTIIIKFFFIVLKVNRAGRVNDNHQMGEVVWSTLR